uniref:CASP-like protein n=1 Tax=Nelumbo nucifera TaxID=4432 RepID=A0A822Y4R7_NELNU|nr:TPA_asm: hypothetical protein HUJ06_028998 [Nelumbo nucifera]
MRVFAYLLLSADAAGTALSRTLRGGDTCTATSSFCVQSDISIALGFTGFLFRVRWHYRPEESIGGRRQFHGAKELFLRHT